MLLRTSDEPATRSEFDQTGAPELPVADSAGGVILLAVGGAATGQGRSDQLPSR